jgi:putative RNA 2'-phosphotransferase
VEPLIQGIQRNGHGYFTFDILKEVVETNNKKRFAFNADCTKIRANQGHSVAVDVELPEAVPPEYLYHGTAERFLEAIKQEGLVPKSRLHVHLSADTETARNVGGRHGKPIILTVKAGEMHEAGYRFCLSANGVWLTESVLVRYIGS